MPWPTRCIVIMERSTNIVSHGLPNGLVLRPTQVKYINNYVFKLYLYNYHIILYVYFLTTCCSHDIVMKHYISLYKNFYLRTRVSPPYPTRTFKQNFIQTQCSISATSNKRTLLNFRFSNIKVKYYHIRAQYRILITT